MKRLTKILFPCLLIIGCTSKPEHYVKVSPAKVENGVVILTAEAEQRLGIVVETARAEGKQTTLRASSILYDVRGATWVFTQESPLHYRRQKVELKKVRDSSVTVEAVISSPVVVIGAAELYGTESGVGK